MSFNQKNADNDRCITFVGDSGQGDEIVARALLGLYGSYEDPILSNIVLNHRMTHHVWIHHLLHVEKNDAITIGFTLPPRLDRENSYIRFHSYPEAAYIAYSKGVISRKGLQSVIDAVLKDEVWIKCKSMKQRNDLEKIEQGKNDISNDMTEPCGKGHGDRCCKELFND